MKKTHHTPSTRVSTWKYPSICTIPALWKIRKGTRFQQSIISDCEKHETLQDFEENKAKWNKIQCCCVNFYTKAIIIIITGYAL